MKLLIQHPPIALLSRIRYRVPVVKPQYLRYMKFIHYLLLLLLLPTVAAVAQQSYYFPAVISFDSRIPTPAQFLGYPIGSHYTRHDRIIDYFRELARLSDRVHIQETGQTYEAR